MKMDYQRAIEIVEDLDHRGHPTYKEAKELAIEACNKQVDKKVKMKMHLITHSESGFGNIYYCPCCNHIIKKYEDGWMNQDLINNFCNKCGQKLDWNIWES